MLRFSSRLSQGFTFKEALDASLTDLDGSFSYLAATENYIGFAKDPFAFKPLLLTEPKRRILSLS